MGTNLFKDMNNVTTLLAIENQLTAALGIDMTYRPATTINTKRGVLADVVPKVVPRIRYFGIGIKGYANLTSQNNIAQPFAYVKILLDILCLKKTKEENEKF